MIKRSVLLIFFITFFSLNSFSIGFNLIKIVTFLSKISKKMSVYEKNIEKYQQDFRKYYNKYWKNFNRKFFPGELKLLKMDDPSKIYNKSYVKLKSDKEIWNKIFKTPGYLWKRYSYLLYTDHYKNNDMYRKNIKFRKKMDRNIEDLKIYLKEIDKVVRLIADTRKMQQKRGKKILKIKKQNDLLGRPKVYWEAKRVKLLTFGTMLDFEIQHQIVELIMLMNAQTELKVKSLLLLKNMKEREKSE